MKHQAFKKILFLPENKHENSQLEKNLFFFSQENADDSWKLLFHLSKATTTTPEILEYL